MARSTDTRQGAGRISDRIAASIRRQIADGRLTAGTRLPAEREMARRHKVSRVAVREAYRSLEVMGLLTVRRGAAGGAVIAEPVQRGPEVSLSLMLRLGRTSDEELGDAWTIEPLVARLAARHATSGDITRLRQVIDRQEAAVARLGHARAHRFRFQRALAGCTRNRPLVAMVNALSDLTLELLASSDLGRASEEAVCRLHRSIFEAVERRDEAAAQELMWHPAVSVRARITERLEQRRWEALAITA